jgi:hypothetical protein
MNPPPVLILVYLLGVHPPFWDTENQDGDIPINWGYPHFPPKTPLQDEFVMKTTRIFGLGASITSF